VQGKGKRKEMRHIKLLGLKAKDKVTGFGGVITTLSFDLYGCVQVVITPKAITSTGKMEHGQWVDITRLELKSKKPVMEIPNFEKGYIADGKKGCAEKPAL
jgi:hypothetical protein